MTQKRSQNTSGKNVCVTQDINILTLMATLYRPYVIWSSALHT